MVIYTLYVVCAMFIITIMPNAIISTILYVEFKAINKSFWFCGLRQLNTLLQMIRFVNYAANFFYMVLAESNSAVSL